MILLMICANLNDYFISGNDQYIFNTEYCPGIVGIVLIYTLAESLVYKSVIGCLKGNMRVSEVFKLNNSESLFGWLCSHPLLHTDDFLCDPFVVRAHNGAGGWRTAESHIFVQKLRKVHRVKKRNIAGAFPFDRAAVFLHDYQKRFLQLQKLFDIVGSGCSHRTSSANFQSEETFFLIIYFKLFNDETFIIKKELSE
jgi:hypothetical protein